MKHQVEAQVEGKSKFHRTVWKEQNFTWTMFREINLQFLIYYVQLAVVGFTKYF